jgi:hypothetical protein
MREVDVGVWTGERAHMLGGGAKKKIRAGSFSESFHLNRPYTLVRPRVE